MKFAMGVAFVDMAVNGTFNFILRPPVFVALLVGVVFLLFLRSVRKKRRADKLDWSEFSE